MLETKHKNKCKKRPQNISTSAQQNKLLQEIISETFSIYLFLVATGYRHFMLNRPALFFDESIPKRPRLKVEILRPSKVNCCVRNVGVPVFFHQKLWWIDCSRHEILWFLVIKCFWGLFLKATIVALVSDKKRISTAFMFQLTSL